MPEQLLVSEVDAARMLSVSPKTVSRLVTAGRMPVVRVGARKLYDVNDLRAWIDAAKTVTNPERSMKIG